MGAHQTPHTGVDRVGAVNHERDVEPAMSARYGDDAQPVFPGLQPLGGLAHDATSHVSSGPARAARCCTAPASPRLTPCSLTTSAMGLACRRRSTPRSLIRSRVIGILSVVTKRCAGPCSGARTDRKSTRLNSSHVKTSYAVFC